MASPTTRRRSKTMDTLKTPKRRRARGSGSVYRIGRIWWISYYGPDGKRHAESSESERKGDGERLDRRPEMRLLDEAPPRQGCFEADQMASVLAHLPEELRPVVEFGYVTGWRIASEVLPLEWGRVDFAAGDVRLDVGTTKNG